MSANRAMALRVVWATRVDDDTPGAGARELLEMLGLIAPGGDEILPDTTTAGRLLDVTGRPVATAPPPSRRPSAALKPKRKGGKGRAPKPIEHGTDYGYLQHKRKHEPIPADDSCGCQAAHDALLLGKKKPAVPPAAAPVEVWQAGDQVSERSTLGELDPLVGQPKTVAEASPGLVIARPTGPTASEIRGHVDAMVSRTHPDGSINAQHVAIEQTLRQHHGHPSYIAELDGPGKFRPGPSPEEIAAFELAEQLADDEVMPPELPLSAPSPTPTTLPAAAPPPVADEPPAPGLPSGRMPCVVRPILEPRNPVDPAPSHRAYGDLAARARVNWRGTVSKAEVLPTPAPLDVDAWLTRAQESTRPAIRRRATQALACLMQLRCALDELARAERGGVR